MNFKKSDYRWFEAARKEALQSDFENIHIGCVLVYHGHVIGSGHNTNKTCPQQKQYNSYRKFRKNPNGKPINHSTHAEIAAIKSVPYPIEQNIDWSNVKLYVFRISKGKSLGQGMSRPCPSCMKALKDKGIKKIYYSTDEGFAFERVF